MQNNRNRWGMEHPPLPSGQSSADFGPLGNLPVNVRGRKPLYRQDYDPTEAQRTADSASSALGILSEPSRVVGGALKRTAQDPMNVFVTGESGYFPNASKEAKSGNWGAFPREVMYDLGMLGFEGTMAGKLGKKGYGLAESLWKNNMADDMGREAIRLTGKAVKPTALTLGAAGAGATAHPQETQAASPGMIASLASKLARILGGDAPAVSKTMRAGRRNPRQVKRNLNLFERQADPRWTDANRNGGRKLVESGESPDDVAEMLDEIAEIVGSR